MSIPNRGKRLIVTGKQKTGGYMLIVNEDATEGPFSLYVWESGGKLSEVTLDHEALKDIAEAFTEYTGETGKRGTDNGKEKRFYYS